MAAVNPTRALAVRHQLERILASDVFIQSERLCRFLRWTVEETLDGRSEGLKQYAIGRDVFDRDERFDPRVDSIVRSEAQRLRKKLAEYYQASGAADAVRIEFSPGSYVPVFREPSVPATPAVEPDLLDPRKVAVLPFANLGPDPDPHYFCEGIAEAILDELAVAPGLRVVARTSAFRYQGQEGDAEGIGKQLGAATLVEGSVRRSGSRLRVSAKAIDTRTGEYVWAQMFDRTVDDIFAIQDEIARAVAEKLRVTLLPNAAPSAAPGVEAYSIYLRGRHFWNQLTIDGFRKALAEFQRATTLYPDYAQPYAGLADVYSWLLYFGAGKPADLWEKARQAAETALRLDPVNVDATSAMGGVVGCYDWKWDEAERLLRRALQLQPSYLVGEVRLLNFHLQRGDLEAASGPAQAMMRLDPLSIRFHRGLGVYYYMARDYEAALSSLERARQLNPAAVHTRYIIGQVLLQMDRAQEALEEFEASFAESLSDLAAGGLIDGLVRTGSQQRAERMMAGLLGRARRSEASPLAVARALIALNDVDQALVWMERACEDHWTGLGSLLLDPQYDALRDDARFQTILRRMNLV